MKKYVFFLVMLSCMLPIIINAQTLQLNFTDYSNYPYMKTGFRIFDPMGVKLEMKFFENPYRLRIF